MLILATIRILCEADTLSRRINRWLGYGFIVGMPLGLLMCIVFIARIAL